jgi:ABC-type bacteriocin/lantibiotic exporter with double-glycine peptidase domain
VITPLLTRTIVDSVIPHKDGRLLLIIGLSLVPSGVLFALAWYIRARMLIALRSVFDVSASLDFVHHLLSLRFTDLQRWTTGDLAARFDSHNQVRDYFAHHVLFAASDGLLVVGYVISLVLINLPLGIACALMTLLQAGVLLLSSAQRSKLWEEKLSAQKECTSFEHDIIAGVETIKGMSLLPAVITRWSGMFVRLMNAMVLRWNRDVVVESILVTARLSFPVVVLSIGAWEAMASARPVGELIAHAAICNWFIVPLSNLAHATMMLHMLHPHVVRVTELLATGADARPRSPPEARREQPRGCAAPSRRGAFTCSSTAVRFSAASTSAPLRVSSWPSSAGADPERPRWCGCCSA